MLHRKSALLGATILAGTLFAVSPALAQSGAQAGPQAPDPAAVQPNSDDAVETAGDQETEVDAVVVTGSRIRRDPTNAPTPLQQFNREEILQSGEASVIDYLADVPALS